MPSSEPDLGSVEQRPIEVVLFAFNGFEDTAARQRDGWQGLRAFATWLNAGQDLFEFKAAEPELVLKAGSQDGLHAVTASHYYDCLSQQLDSYADIECGIGLTHQPLDGNEFNHHDQRRGVGVITIEGYQQYIPETGSLDRYLAYLTFCEAFCLAGRQQYEHAQHWKCLFDLCGDKPELEDCLRFPRICGRCRKRLSDSGFSDASVTAVEEFLQRSAKPAIGSALASALRRPTVSLLAGALIAVVAATYSAENEGLLAWLPAVALALACSVSVFWEYLSARLDRRSFANSKSRWRGWWAARRRWLAAKLR